MGVVNVAPSPAVRARGSLAGLLGAASSLVVLELVALADATGTSVLEAVGNRFVERFAASLKEIAIALFGTGDKAALQIGTVVIALAVGALVGSRAAERPNLVLATFAGFGLLGMVAAADDPLASLPVAVVGCALAALVGAAVTLGLVGRWTSEQQDAPADGADGADGAVDAVEAATAHGAAGDVPRRSVLVNAGVLGGLLLLGVGVARTTRDAMRSAASTVSRALPRPVRTVPVPEDPLDLVEPLGSPPLEGLSPFVTPTADFFRIDTALRVPIVDVDTWELRVTGLVDRELVLTYDDLLGRDHVEVPITIQCVSNEVGGELIGTARWLGVPLADVLADAGVQPKAEQLVGESVDGFTAGFPVQDALDGREALIAVGMNGRPLTPVHGYPVRLIVPGLYGYVSATKWLSEIRLTTWEEEGFWIPRGWSRLGPIKTQSRIDVPRRGVQLTPGAQAVAGVAWAPHRGITRVEVRVDEGPWSEATIGPTTTEDTWVQWWWRWEATPGEHQLQIRATDADGVIQTAETAEPAPDGATGYHTRTVTVVEA